MNIRPFRSEDTDQVIALWQSCELVVPWNDPLKDILRKLSVQPDLFLVATDNDDVLIGTVMGGYDGHRGWINYLAVSQSQRRSGLGRLLVEQIEARLIALGCPKINLMVRSTNTQVVEFYEQLGFTQENVVALGKRLIPDN